MRHVTVLAVFALLFSALNASSADSFTFNPQAHTAQVETIRIWFIDNATNEPAGPGLFADETDPQFFALITTIVQNAQNNNSALKLHFENVTSQAYGAYGRIIPAF